MDKTISTEVRIRKLRATQRNTQHSTQRPRPELHVVLREATACRGKVGSPAQRHAAKAQRVHGGTARGVAPAPVAGEIEPGRTVLAESSGPSSDPANVPVAPAIVPPQPSSPPAPPLWSVPERSPVAAGRSVAESPCRNPIACSRP